MLREQVGFHRQNQQQNQHASASGAGPRERTGSSNALVLGALGVVFGDIGTNPIYALREGALTSHSSAPSVIMGLLSMILWAVVIVVVLKYACFVMRADNEGEGGIVALTALVRAGFLRTARIARRVAGRVPAQRVHRPAWGVRSGARAGHGRLPRQSAGQDARDAREQRAAQPRVASDGDRICERIRVGSPG
ncbi:hypothetical protein PSAC2689_60299 [Paraburkholderia sacchari]